MVFNHLQVWNIIDYLSELKIQKALFITFLRQPKIIGGTRDEKHLSKFKFNGLIISDNLNDSKNYISTKNSLRINKILNPIFENNN